MGILEEVENSIDRMRQALYEVIGNKENLLDINTSQKLDSILNEYNDLNKKLK